MPTPLPRIVWGLARVLRAEPAPAAPALAPLIALLDALDRLLPEGALAAGADVVPLRRALAAAYDARDAAVLAQRPTDAMLLAAAGYLAEAVELLHAGDEQEARGYAGYALMPLAERRVERGTATSKDEAVAALKAALKAQLA